MTGKRKRLKKRWAWAAISIFIVAAVLFHPTWTPSLKSENSISILESMIVNGAEHTVMIRGENRDNPILLFVHGGPGSSEIPYVRKYQDLLEQQFTIVHYDQRGSGKSYRFFEDYTKLTTDLLVDDLLALTEQVKERLKQEKVILAGHSFGTYIGMKAAAKSPESFAAYIGIGQVGDHHASELDSFAYVLEQARAADAETDIDKLEQLRPQIEGGEKMTPRSLIRKYGGAARLIDDNRDYYEGFLLNPEYNGLDVLRYLRGIAETQSGLLEEESAHPLPDVVRELAIPCYFVMGVHDYMTSVKAAQSYFELLDAPKKEFIVFEHSAHYPQFEEKERFAEWMADTFLETERIEEL
ncbi:alpha/beta hydrolase [Paenibacillus sp. 1011MAR3C5]|uniref:alpha/beta fold hydrolase n=1 Tax=Paenibacillus sp. 1011MAR3C5 TaxID=1675787 RepID=UPI000E6C246D|nr:alpha/beta hydrolase [Paenibacillus sp. 1011MAR3C5]RJE89711.1 alpha/beta hydrolase [Paenibacillus sp. 1011MAR3C5]